MKCILVIDDNIDIRENTAEILELAGYKTITAENGKKGVELALKNKPSLIICDIMMPELDGYGVLHLLRKHADTRLIPFIFLSAKTERTDMRKGMEMGTDDYITKPFEDIELLSAVEVRLKKNEVFEEKYVMSKEGVGRFLKDVKAGGMMDKLADEYEVEVYPKKHQLYQAGKRPRFLYNIIRGKVKIYKVHEDGKEYITDIHTAGDFLGFSALLEDRNYDENAVVLEEAEIMPIPKDDFLEMVYTDINVAIKFIGIITQNVRQKEERLLNLAYSSLRKRVAKALLDIAAKNNAGTGLPMIEISRDDIAHYIGTATESLIRTLSDFKSENLISIKEGKVAITDITRLQNLAY